MRLIDADVLIKKLLKVDDDVVRACIGVIMTERTAYNAEKVVEQLLDDYVKNGGMFLYEEVIETVRKGGVK